LSLVGENSGAVWDCGYVKIDVDMEGAIAVSKGTGGKADRSIDEKEVL